MKIPPRARMITAFVFVPCDPNSASSELTSAAERATRFAAVAVPGFAEASFAEVLEVVFAEVALALPPGEAVVDSDSVTADQCEAGRFNLGHSTSHSVTVGFAFALGLVRPSQKSVVESKFEIPVPCLRSKRASVLRSISNVSKVLTFIAWHASGMSTRFRASGFDRSCVTTVKSWPLAWATSR